MISLDLFDKINALDLKICCMADIEAELLDKRDIREVNLKLTQLRLHIHVLFRPPCHQIRILRKRKEELLGLIKYISQ